MSSNSNDDDPQFRIALYQWSVRMSGIALEMVVPAAAGIGLDRLCGTFVLFTILGVFLGMALGFWQLLKIAIDITRDNNGIDKPPDTRDNNRV